MYVPLPWPQVTGILQVAIMWAATARVYSETVLFFMIIVLIIQYRNYHFKDNGLCIGSIKIQFRDPQMCIYIS